MFLLPMDMLSCATADTRIPIHITATAAISPNIFNRFFIFSPLIQSLKIFDPEVEYPARVVKLRTNAAGFRQHFASTVFAARRTRSTFHGTGFRGSASGYHSGEVGVVGVI
jgi:hypothetical protein